MNKIKFSLKVFSLGLLIFGTFFIVKVSNSAANNSRLADNLAGKILLQVEEKGEAWYVNPQTKERSFLGRPDDAFKIMRQEAVGITSLNLKKIPISLEHIIDKDSDGDGLSDDFEKAIGTDQNKKDTDGDGFDDYTELLHGFDPLKGSGVRLSYDNNFANKQKGKIFLDVERNGEAWYINPDDGKRYFLGRPSDAFELMRRKGLGITNANLNQIKEKAGYQHNNTLKEKNIILSLSQAKEIADKFINTNFDGNNATTTIVSIKEENNLYVLEVKTKDNITTSHITRDGKIFFPSSLDLEGMLKDRSFSSKKLKIEEVKDISKEFIDNYLMSNNKKSNILSVSDLDVHSLYKLEVYLEDDNKVDSYISHDGKLFFPLAYYINEGFTDNNQINKTTSQSLDYRADILICNEGKTFSLSPVFAHPAASSVVVSSDVVARIQGFDDDNNCVITYTTNRISAQQDKEIFYDKIVSVIIRDGYSEQEAKRMLEEPFSNLSNDKLNYIKESLEMPNIMDDLSKTLKVLINEVLLEGSMKNHETRIIDSVGEASMLLPVAEHCYASPENMLKHSSDYINGIVDPYKYSYFKNGIICDSDVNALDILDPNVN